MSEPLDARDFTLGHTTFVFRRFSPAVAYEVAELIRPALRDLLSEPFGDRDDDRAHLSPMLRIFSGFPQDVAEQVRQICFRHVDFTALDTPTPKQLAGNENEAFENLDWRCVYEMIGRCLYLNFIQGAFDEILESFLASLIPNP